MNPDSKVFHHANGMTSTVTIEPIGAENDEEPLLDNFSNRDDDEEHAVGTSFKEEEQVQGVTKEASEPQRMGTKKLSKQSLKIIERTKLKIQGKHLKRTKKNTSSNEKHSRNVKRRKGRR